MASDLSFVEYVCDQLKNAGIVTYKKMFGEYLVYASGKPAVLICDNTAFIKILPCVEKYLQNSEKGFPYKGAKEHYIADVDDGETLSAIVRAIEKSAPPPKKKIKHAEAKMIIIEALHTTRLGEQRIKRNLGLDTDIVAWCRQVVFAAGKNKNSIMRKGKNWYVYGAGFVLTINAGSHTIITAHKQVCR